MLKQEMSLTNSISSNMNTGRTGSFLTSRSMGTKDIGILVIHDDPMYRNIILEMLENCSHYEVMKFKRTADALINIQEKKDRLNIFLTDVHRSHSNGFEIINYIENEFKVPVISMNPHQNSRVTSVGLDSEAKIYFLKSLSVDDFKTLWQHAYTKERGNPTSFQRVSEVQENEGGPSLEKESPIREVSRADQNHQKRKIEETDEQSEEDKDESPNEKKQRVVWNEAMHRKFLKAVQELGHARSYPKKILEIMKVPGLTRDNVASHLQKYRLCLKSAHEEMKSTSSIFGSNSTPDNYFQPSFSDLNSSDTNSFPYHKENPTFSSSQERSNHFNSSSFSYPENSTSKLNLGQQQFPYAHNPFQVSNTQNNTCNVNISMPLLNLFSNHPETTTGTSHFEQQNFFTVHNQESPIFPYTQNYALFDTTQIHSSPLANENTQPVFSNNNAYVGLRITENGELVECGQTSAPNINANKADFFNEGYGNESLVPFPLVQVNNSNEQGFYMPPAEYRIEDLFNEAGGTASPGILFDFDGSLLEHN